MNRFRSSLWRTYHTELRKILIRRDTLLLFVPILIPLFVSAGIVWGGGILNVSVETNSLNASSFAAQMVHLGVALFVFLFIFSIYTARLYGSEIEQGTMLLYLPRFHSRPSLYYGKSLALHIVAAVTVIVTFFLGIAAYSMILAPNAPEIAAGNLYNKEDLFRSLAFSFSAFCVYALTIEITMALCSYVKFLAALVGYLVIFFIWNIIVYFPVFQYLSPFFYLEEYTGLKEGAAELGLSLPSLSSHVLFLLNILMLVAYWSVTTVIGVKKLKKRDLA